MPSSTSSGHNKMPTGAHEAASKGSSSSVPFPSSKDQLSPIPDSGSSSSNQTSSDKLSALPPTYSPALGRLRPPSRIVRRSLEASGSLPSIDSPSGSLQALQRLPSPHRTSESDGSVGRDTPRQRMSLEDDHTSLPATLQSIRQAVVRRTNHRSHSATRSPSPLSGDGSLKGNPSPGHNHPSGDLRPNQILNFSPRTGKEPQTPTSRSQSQSRAASPLRRLGWALHRTHAKEEPFVPVDPFRYGKRSRRGGVKSPAVFQTSTGNTNEECDDEHDKFAGCLPLPVLCSEVRGRRCEGRWLGLANDTRIFLTDTLPRQAYLILLLGLPALYWSRVARVFEDAEISKPDVQRMVDAYLADNTDFTMPPTGHVHQRSMPHSHTVLLPFPEDWNPPTVSPSLVRFKHSWELFVDSLLREWKTLNLVSALLCTCVLSISAPVKKRAILTMFQVNDAEDDPLTRSAALFGLIFALMSLSYGCVYIVQFGAMRSMDRASRWAEEAQRTRTAILWNIWVMLAAPAIWLAWSMIAFCVSILSYVWRTGSIADANPPEPLNDHQAIGVRTAITFVFALGLLNFTMIIHTFRSYHGTRRERRRGREETRGDAGRTPAPGDARKERRDAMDEIREKLERELSNGISPSMVGLGLSGLSENAMASAGLVGVVREDIDPEKEKGEFLTEKGRLRGGRISPRL